jgi:uncharacterized protein YdeI (YjbR/CyaY-like superfamily)
MVRRFIVYDVPENSRLQATGSASDAGLQRVYAANRQEWHDWLQQYHQTAAGVWLIYYKKESGRPRVAYDEAVEEALCFGWIDSRPNLLDDDRYMQLFSPRKPRSPWSRLNKLRVERLIQQGSMTPAGLAVIEAAQRDGSWTVYDAIEDLEMPDDLAAALAAHEVARLHFEAFSDSSKKNILWWIASARRPETRQKRIDETVRLAAENKRANHYRP